MSVQTTEAVPTVVVIDDEHEIVAMIEAYFRMRQIRVLEGSNGADLRRLLRDDHADLVLLDLGLGGENGIDLAREVRETSDVPLIIVSGLASTTDKVVALELGADDYVTKPFELVELYARVRSVLRRTQLRSHSDSSAPIYFAGFTFHPAQRQLLDADGQPVTLTSGETQLLELLLTHSNRVISRDDLLDWIHGRDAGPFDRSIDMQVARLRRKLGDDPRSPELIKTVRGSGYWFSPDVRRLQQA